MGTYDTYGGTPRHDPAADYFPLCEVCGLDCSDCICPECPVCGESGNPKCVGLHMDASGKAITPFSANTGCSAIERSADVAVVLNGKEHDYTWADFEGRLGLVP